jgi:hypothetical protein
VKAIAVTAGALALSAIAANAEPLPQPKPPGPGGSCPHGYTSSGSARARRTPSPSRRMGRVRGVGHRAAVIVCATAISDDEAGDGKKTGPAERRAFSLPALRSQRGGTRGVSSSRSMRSSSFRGLTPGRRIAPCPLNDFRGWNRHRHGADTNSISE